MLPEWSEEDTAARARRGGGSATALQVHRLRPRRATLLLGVSRNNCVPRDAWAASPTAAAIARSCKVARVAWVYKTLHSRQRATDGRRSKLCHLQR